MSLRPWTQTEIDLLAGMAEEGLTMAEAAKALGRTVYAARSRAHMLGISFAMTPRKEMLVRQALKRGRQAAGPTAWIYSTPFGRDAQTNEQEVPALVAVAYERLRWLYGEQRARDNFAPSRNADLMAWINLGNGRAA